MMTKKFIQLKLLSVSVSDLSIGREWSLEILSDEVQGSIKFRMKRVRQRIEKLILAQSIDAKIKKLKCSFKLSEIDPKWDDVVETKNSIDLSQKEKVLKFKLQVKGRGKREKKKFLEVEIKLGIKVTSAIHFINDVKPNGWLNVKLENQKIHPLPYFLKVEFQEVEDKRLYFKILEGRLIGKVASIAYDQKNNNKYFKEESSSHKHLGSAKLSYKRSSTTLTVQGIGSFNIGELKDLLDFGEYELEIPYEPHLKGARYEDKTKYSKTWFRIGHLGNYYLHVGTESSGCLAVMDIKKWTRLYKYLIRRRLDKKSVGTLVIEK